MKHSLAALILFGGLTLLTATGCASGGYYGRGYYSNVPPPAPRYGVQGYAPGPGYVWADGFYDYRGGRYMWSPGQWVRPPRARSQWVPGRWERDRHGYRLRRGYWR